MIIYMVTPEYNDGKVWYQDPEDFMEDDDANCWSVVWGNHDIELVDGVFYNYYQAKPTKVAELTNARFFDQRLVDALSVGVDFDGKTGYQLFCAQAEYTRDKTALRRYL